MNKDDLKYLKREAHFLKPIFQIGKEGLSKNLLEGLEKAIVVHELIKITVLKTAPQTKKEIIDRVIVSLNATLIDSIGNIFVVYRKGKENFYEL